MPSTRFAERLSAAHAARARRTGTAGIRGYRARAADRAHRPESLLSGRAHAARDRSDREPPRIAHFAAEVAGHSAHSQPYRKALAERAGSLAKKTMADPMIEFMRSLAEEWSA